jgi:hypothetical protein
MLDKLKSRLIGNVVGVVVVLGAFPVSSKEAENNNCCSSLEDRITQLEKKAGKDDGKVSVTVSGWVSKSVTGWSDGTEHQPAPPKE